MTRFDFLGKAKIFGTLSVVLVVASVLAMVTIGLRPGIDFTGGLQLTMWYPDGAVLSEGALRAYIAPLLADVSPTPRVYVQSVTTERDLPVQGRATIVGKIVTVQGATDEQEDRLRDALAQPQVEGIPQPTEFSVTDIGAQVSREIVDRAWQAILAALGAMVVYIAWRFRLRYGVAAVVAVVHDVVITLGVFTLAGLEINLPVIAALLTVIGYSLNDTIVVFDRVRENLRGAKKAPVWDKINQAVNQTLSRTLLTATTTLIPVVILLVFGGVPLREFAVALLVGVIAGTYSTLFVANPVLYWWTTAAERARARRR